MARIGKVYVQNKYAGAIKETDDGYEYSYDESFLSDENAKPISLTLPLTNEPYKSNVLFPFFDGLIPEGWLLGVVERNWKIDGKDRFGLLLASCRDCIGDVYIIPEE
ncbi:MAG: phosphatidylinositol kinase [Pseudobutyrivibrio ruminis]|uniref:HipA N-terminal domain-containing protein n=1 Tax=Pseudobutyrivibrio ruminis TaxID=46206 RepID=UPI0026EE0F60|nr:HipA N-terminal domain-containing protein [Pseudobutyrivibrio ruminis]MBE5913242.1 phosphatidylinositol kinase [Pseudobutyrivibrio ruminis]